MFVCICSIAYGGGFETAGIGARQMNMGGAAIGLADDWTALYWNPAGLAFLEGSHIGFDIRLSTMTQTADKSLRNVPLGASFNPGLGDFPINPGGGWIGFEPSRYDEDGIADNQFRPDVGWYKSFDSFTLGVGLYGSGGMGADWEDKLSGIAGIDTIDAEYHTGVFVLNAPVGFAMKIGERQAFGVSVQILYGKNTSNIKKEYNDQGSGLGDYTYKNIAEGSGYGLEIDLGYMIRLTDTFSLGALYRSHYVLNSEGSATMGFDNPVPPFGYEKSDFVMTMDYPQRIGAGIAWKPFDNLTVTGDIYWIHWTMMDLNFDYDDEGTFLSDRTVMDDLRNTFQLRLGCEYQQTDALAWRFGYYSDASPYSREYASLIQARFYHADVISAGMGYTHNNISYNAMINYTFVHDRSGNDNEIGGSVENLALGMVIGL